MHGPPSPAAEEAHTDDGAGGERLARHRWRGGKRTTFHGTFVTGLYGMNVPYPGFGRAWDLGHRS